MDDIIVIHQIISFANPGRVIRKFFVSKNYNIEHKSIFLVDLN
jgi:hypothetical protein